MSFIKGQAEINKFAEDNNLQIAQDLFSLYKSLAGKKQEVA